MLDSMLFPALVLLVASSQPYAVLKYADYASMLGPASAWAENNIPLLDFPGH